MIIPGAAIHRDGHGKCGLIFTPTFRHCIIPFDASPFCSRKRLSAELTGSSVIISLQQGYRVLQLNHTEITATEVTSI